MINQGIVLSVFIYLFLIFKPTMFNTFELGTLSCTNNFTVKMKWIQYLKIFHFKPFMQYNNWSKKNQHFILFLLIIVIVFFYMNDTSLNFIFINSSQHIKRGSYKLCGKTAKRLPMASLFQLVWNLYQQLMLVLGTYKRKS